MSNGAPPQQVRDRVLQMTREIEELAQSNVPPRTFFRQFLQLVVTAMGARAGAVWMRESLNIKMLAELHLNETGFTDSVDALGLNQKLLQEVLSTGESRAFGPDAERGPVLPTKHVILISALMDGKDCVGAVEIFQRPDAPPGARPGYLQFIEQMCGYASQFLSRRSAPPPSPSASNEFFGEFERFVLALQRTLRVREVAAIAVNDARLLLRCDRVSLLTLRGRKPTVEAISGQETINRRADLVRALTDLAEAATASGDTVTYAGKGENLPPQIEEPLALYIHHSESRMVMVVPLFSSEPLPRGTKREQLGEKPKKNGRPIGCLVLEQFGESQPSQTMKERSELVVDHIGAALGNALSHERIFLLGLWQALGDARDRLRGRTLAKVVAAAVAIAVISTVLVVVPWKYRVSADGRLMPVLQQQVFAPSDGEVIELYVKSGDHVEKGQKLLQLQNEILRADLLTNQTELNEKRKLVLTLQAQLDDVTNQGDREKKIELSGKIREAQIEIDGLNEQIRILEARTADLTIRAPITGIVATFQLEQLLKFRPVGRGEVLIEIKDDTGPWRVELDVEEHRMGHILRGQQARGEVPLDIEYVLATAPESTYYGQLDSMSTRAVTSAEKGSVVEVLAATDASSIPERRIGAEVSAKIDCGKRALGYVLFGDVIEFIRQYLWL